MRVLAGDAQELGQPRAGGHEHGVIAFLVHQLVDRHGLADDDVGLEVDAHRPHDVDLAADDLLGQAELGDAVDQHAADLVQGLEDGDLVALLDQVAGRAQAGRSAAHDGHLLAGGRGDLGQADLARLALVVGHEPLEVADAQGLELVAQDAAALALGLLGADPAGDGRQDVVLADLGRGLQIVSRDDQLDEVLDLDPDRAARHALGRGALQAAQGLGGGAQHGQALVHLLEISSAAGRHPARACAGGES